MSEQPYRTNICDTWKEEVRCFNRGFISNGELYLNTRMKPSRFRRMKKLVKYWQRTF